MAATHPMVLSASAQLVNSSVPKLPQKSHSCRKIYPSFTSLLTLWSQYDLNLPLTFSRLLTGLKCSCLDDNTASTMDVGVNVDIVLTEVAFKKRLILDIISTGQHEVVVRANEPVEFLEPTRLQRREN